ncbi:PREDICTED: nucleolar GTP-binding protein 2-like isoform X2 [Priapulus caudatus]|uniref:Nucleolar GTP-binding protein 2 n=1 Tax=Priapulus caudatus TaxID=37621 RepID=A0ABM1EPR5_PRICU|nr:PREDICTED: nucleolar GTP-binding protein 2-like isoform X2 [Priapulus caudatus]
MGKARTAQPRRAGNATFNKAQNSTNPDRVKTHAGMRDKSTIKRLLMYKNFKPVRNKIGKVVKAAPFQSWVTSGAVSRVEPNRRWFGNTRVVTQKALQTFQDEMGKVVKDPYRVVMKQTKLPITLLNETAKNARVHILDTESFETTFGKKAQRKRPNLKTTDMETMADSAMKSGDTYNAEKDNSLVKPTDGITAAPKEMIFFKGQSKRIWNELYKVIDSSDVVIQVLDARDPIGTRSPYVENYMRKEKSYKHLIFVINKVDLVPTWVTQRWVALLSHEYPTLAFHASMQNPFGKGSLISLLRQFAKLHSDKRQISVGLIGYPNTGKSSIINTLRNRKVCNVAPIAGETKVRVEKVEAPEDYIATVLERVKPEYLAKTYRVSDWTDSEQFLEMCARRSGKLLKGGEPDLSTVAKIVLNDWQRGKLPYFVKPPGCEDRSAPFWESTKESKSIAKVGESLSVDESSFPEGTGDEKPQLPQVKVVQDFSQITVGPEFFGDDVQPLAVCDGPADSDVISDSEVEEEEEEKEVARNEEMGKTGAREEDEYAGESRGGSGVVIGAPAEEALLPPSDDDGMSGLSDMIQDGDFVSKPDGEENIEDRDSNMDRDSDGSLRQSETPVETAPHTSNEASKSDVDLTRISTDLKLASPSVVKKKMKRNKKKGGRGTGPDGRVVKKSRSGAFTVTDVADDWPTNKQKTTGCFTKYTVRESANVALVDVEPSSGRKNKREFTEDKGMDPGVRLTSKERRRIERSARDKKVGVHYYSVADIKGRRKRK